MALGIFIRGLRMAAIIIKREQEKAILNSKMASLGVLSAGMGHEINNPLAVIQGNLELLRRGISKLEIEDEKIFKRVDTSLDAVKKIAKIVDGLKTMARSSQNLDLIPLNTHTTIAKSVGMLEDVYFKDGITIDTQMDAASCFIEGDEARLQQVLINLISNAKDALLEKKARDESFDNLVITISTKNIGDELHILVVDKGEGIKESDQDKIFDSFFTTKEVNKGTGLGLNISANIMQEMKGRIDFQSSWGEGTSFELIFQSVRPPQVLESKRDNELVDLSSRRILVAEDLPDLNDLLSEMLKDQGAEVYSTFNGVEAYQKLSDLNGEVDLLLTDLKMPEMNGEELIKKIRESSIFSKLPILLLTGGIQTQYHKEEQEKILSLVQGYLSKPFNQSEILLKIDQTLKKT